MLSETVEFEGGRIAVDLVKGEWGTWYVDVSHWGFPVRALHKSFLSEKKARTYFKELDLLIKVAAGSDG